MRSLLLAFVCLASHAVGAGAQVVSDRHWKVSPREEPGWTALAFDDSRWSTPAGPHPDAWSGGDPIVWSRDASAWPLWSGSQEPRAYLRRVFDLPADAPPPAIAYVQADDDYVLFVNGEKVAENRDRQLTVPGEAYDVTGHLRPGRNVVAIEGIDTGFGEHVLFALHWGEASTGITAAPPDRPPEPTRSLIQIVSWRSVAAVLLLVAGVVWLGATRPVPATALRALPIGLGLAAIVAAQLLLTWPRATDMIDGTGALLLLAGGSLIVAYHATATARIGGGAAAAPSAGPRGIRPAFKLTLGLLLALCLIHTASVVLAIRSEQGFSRLLLRWLVSLGAAALLAGLWDRARGRALGPLLTGREWSFCAAATVGAAVLYSFDLGSYRYAFIGDEFAFFGVARDLARGTLAWDNPFSEDGIWGYQPRLSSLYQAFVMRVVGVSNVGWRWSSVLAAALCLPPCYVFLKISVSTRAAWFGTLALGLSHFALTFAHIGYNNNHVLLPTIACLALVAAGQRTGAALGFVLGGIAAGLGFYTFYSARLAILLAAIFFLLGFFQKHRRTLLAHAAWLALGFALTVAPALAEPGRFLDNMRRQSVFAPAEGAAAACWSCVTPQQEARIARNTVSTLLSPAHFNASSHFVSGTLVDAITAALFAVGLAAALLLATRAPVFPFLAALFVVPALVLGISTPYDDPPVTRLLFLVLPICLLAGLGADRLLSLLPSARLRRVVFLGMIAGVAVSNLHRVHVASPRDNGIHTQALVVRYLQEAPPGVRRYYLLPDEWGAELIVLHLELYRLPAEVLHFRDVRDAPGRLRTPCEVLFNQDIRERRDEMIEGLQRTHDGTTLRRFTDPGGRNEMLVLSLP